MQNTFTVTVAPVVTSVTLATSNTKVALTPSTPYTVSGSTQGVLGQAFDQFGNLISSGATWTWGIPANTSGTKAKISSSSATANYTFSAAGTYNGSVSVSAGGQSVSAGFAFSIAAVPTSITATAKNGTAAVTTTSTQISIGSVLDHQFRNAISTSATYAWTATTALPSGRVGANFQYRGNDDHRHLCCGWQLFAEAYCHGRNCHGLDQCNHQRRCRSDEPRIGPIALEV